MPVFSGLGGACFEVLRGALSHFLNTRCGLEVLVLQKSVLALLVGPGCQAAHPFTLIKKDL